MCKALSALIGIAFLLVGASCQSKDSEPTFTWPTSASASANELRQQGFHCLEEGRELYPLLFACTTEGASPSEGIYLYANDRNDLVGIRAFAADTTMTLFSVATSLAGLPTSLHNRLTFEAIDSRLEVEGGLVEGGGFNGTDGLAGKGGLVVESGVSGDVRYLRLTPKSRISTQRK